MSRKTSYITSYSVKISCIYNFSVIYLLHVEKKASDPTKITRSKVWIAGHTHADGRPVRPEFEQTIVRSSQTLLLVIDGNLY